jgi:hypothetical protein
MSPEFQKLLTTEYGEAFEHPVEDAMDAQVDDETDILLYAYDDLVAYETAVASGVML